MTTVCHEILHFGRFRTSTACKENFIDVHKLEFLTNLDVNLTASLGGVMNTVLNI